MKQRGILKDILHWYVGFCLYVYTVFHREDEQTQQAVEKTKGKEIEE